MDAPYFPTSSLTGKLAREMDWSAHPLGPLGSWPIALSTAASIVLNSHFPMFFTWGEARSFFYNDAYIPVLGAKHPAAFGRPFQEVWQDIWPDLLPLVLSVDRGEAVYLENLKLRMNRNGFEEETFFTFSYSPLRDIGHEVRGLLCACIETTSQLRAHEALSRSEASLKLALASAEMGTWEVSLPQGQMKFSPEAQHIFGYGAEFETSSAAIEACVHPADRERVETKFSAAVESQSAYSDDYRILRPNGEVRWIHSRGRTRWDEQERQNFFTGLIIDITDRKTATRAIEESEARFRQISEALPQLVWTARPDGGVDYLSPQWVSYTGISERPQLINGWLELAVHPEDRARVAAHWAGALAGKHPYDIEYRLRAADGTYRWFKARATAITGAGGETLYWFGTSTDIDDAITARINFERNVDGSPAILWITVLDGSCTYLSRQWYDYTGQTTEEALGFGWLEATHPEDKARAGAIFVNANAAQAPFYTEYRLRTRDGRYRWAIDAGNPRYDKDGKYCGYAGTVIDVHDRKMAEIRSEAERQKFEAIFVDSAASMALLRGPEFIFEKVNPRYKSLLGDRELVGMPLFTALSELRGLPFQDYMREVFATGQPYVAKELPVKLIRRPGGAPETTFLDFTYSRVEDGEGLPYGIYIHAVDVSDQVRAREALKLQSQALELALSEAPLAEVLVSLVKIIERQAAEETLASILMLDPEGKRLLTGAAPSLPAAYNDLIHGMEIGDGWGSCGTAAYLAQHVVVTDIQTDPRWADFKHLAAEHGLAACWSSPIVSSENQVLGTFALYRRIPSAPTEQDFHLVEVATRTAAIILERHRANEKRRMAELALRASQERLQLSLIAGSIGFWEWDAKTGFVFLSDTLMNDWGIDPAAFKNTLPECLARIHPEDRDPTWQRIERAATKKENYDVEYRVIRPDGKIIWINAKGKLLLDEAGAAERLSGVTINITERKRAEEDLRSAVRARDQFLSIASHELKTPLTSLRLQAQLHKRAIFKNDPTAYSAPRVDSIVEQTEKQVNRLTRLVDDMLDVSRIRSGQLTLEREPFTFATLAEEIVGRLKNQFLSAGYPEPQVSTSAGTEGAWDRLRVEQVVTNLLTNAIRYGKKNPVTVGVANLGDQIRLTVEDGGIGIAPEAREKIFDRFERAVDANEVSGLGLGLFISKQIVNAHGGRIWVESTEGGGSRFVLELPKAKAESAGREVVNVL